MKKSGLALVVGLALGFLMGFGGAPRMAQASPKVDAPPPPACCAAAGNGCCAG